MTTATKDKDTATPPTCNLEDTNDESPRESRKRLRDHAMKDLSLRDDDANPSTGSSSSSSPSLKLQRLRLEAMFHPKFENERQNQTSPETDVRQDMRDRVSQRKGYLEVSLKHSGSLLLWSGGQRYYSKNSTDNLYTHVGEILLRQHFARAWWWKDDSSCGIHVSEKHYRDCSDFVEQQRLTLAFEAVTSILGHHGALPHRDYLILTAVADRNAERFYSTAQVLEFAHRFRLPHNDVWAFAQLDSCDRLFDLYDTTRETGMADDTVHALTEAADAHVSSLYPHAVFQGILLEGLVIRYVSSSAQGSQWEELAAKAQNILSQVPPETPPCFTLASASKVSSPVLATDIRTLARDGLEASIQQILRDNDGGTRRDTERQPGLDLLGMVRQLRQDEETSDSLDEETRRIAQMLGTLENLGSPVDYRVIKETIPDQPLRWLCSIHVRFDQTHKKFRSQQVPGGMALFRGFAIELGMDNGDVSVLQNRGTLAANSIQRGGEEDEARDSLMLKMKFLPYMVRTFCCRNGLSVIASKGPTAFTEYTFNLMTKWNMSAASIQKWQSFFGAWGIYAKACLDGTSMEYTDPSLPPLSSANYLHHYDHFTGLYENGKITDTLSSKPTSTFRGIVVVVSITSKKSAIVADYLAEVLGGLRRCRDIRSITTYDLTLSCAPQGGGLVCSACLDNGAKHVRKHLATHGESIFVVLFGCSEESIASDLLEETEGQRKKMIGQLGAWRKTRCPAVIELAESALYDVDQSMLDDDNETSDYQPTEDFYAAVRQLKEVSEKVPKADMRPGLLVVFPCIPGSGKSALSNHETKVELVAQIMSDSSVSRGETDSVTHPRDVSIFVGDETKTKFWPLVERERGKNPSSVCIADKNAPPSAWSTVGMVASKSLGVVVPVLPDNVALQTTTLNGVQLPDGSLQNDRVHFYPFTLHYLAVCLARVMTRDPGSHRGKLDSSTPMACMIVLKFFALYRFIAAEKLVDSIQQRIESSNAMTSSTPIQVPFFAEPVPAELPLELKDSLVRALQIQFGYDLEQKDFSKNGGEMAQEIDTQLRTLIGKHSDMLLSLAADEAVSRQSFVCQIVSKISELSGAAPLPHDEKRPGHIVLCAIDVRVEDVHAIIRANRQRVAAFLDSMIATQETVVGSAERLPGTEFVQDTHVTMAHKSSLSQSTMRGGFEALLGSTVDVTVTGLLWSGRVAALKVQVATETHDAKPVPTCRNAFPHITLWRKDKKVASKESNDLPGLVDEGKAVCVKFDEASVIQGRVSFWDKDRSTNS